MARMQNPNLALLEAMVKQLAELADDLVFVGGCATGLLITDLAAPPIRATKDVDAIVQTVSYGEYNRLAEKLRLKGFREDSSDGAPLCRWVQDGLILDVMPTDKNILGFGNRWYESAALHAQDFVLPTMGNTIRLITAPYFLITKMEAFDGRGQNDFVASHDIEDIIAVLDGRVETVLEIKRTEQELKLELSKRFKTLIQNGRFLEAVPGHMPPESTSSARLPIIMNVIQEIADLC